MVIIWNSTSRFLLDFCIRSYENKLDTLCISLCFFLVCHAFFFLELIYLAAPLLPSSNSFRGFPCSSAGKESVCNAGDTSSIPGWEDPLDDKMVGWHHWLNGYESEQTLGDSVACCSPWGRRQSDMTWQLNNNNKKKCRKHNLSWLKYSLLGNMRNVICL